MKSLFLITIFASVLFGANQPQKEIFIVDNQGSSRSLYLITKDGDLLWYGDRGVKGSSLWASGSGNRVGWGWHNIVDVISGGNGQLYAIDSAGRLKWFRDTAQNGTVSWASGSGNVIGSGWGVIRKAIGGGNGLIYAIDTNGNLRWYRDAAQNGSVAWAVNSGNIIGEGWQTVRHACSIGNGKIYAVDNLGNLRWYQDVAQNGTWAWAVNSGNVIGSEWNQIVHMGCGPDGHVYGVTSTGQLKWFRDVNQSGITGWEWPGSGNVVGSGWIGHSFHPGLVSFGYGTMTVNNKKALGTRPAVIFLVEYDNHPTIPKSTSYYDQLMFRSSVTPPFSTPANPASLKQFVEINSNRRFSISRAGQGVVGPLKLPALTSDPGPEGRLAQIFREASNQGFNFALFDANNDSNVTSDELLVVTIENVRALQPANRRNSSVFLNGKIIALDTAMNGPVTSFDSISHEFTHSFGTQDMYYSGCQNSGSTLMGCTDFYSDFQNPIQLDAWHKLRLGWIEPKVIRLSTAQSTQVDVDTHLRANGSVILWDDTKGSGEFFIVERRLNSNFYDIGATGNGVVIWHVSNTVMTRSSPDLTIGGSTPWTNGSVTPQLTWSNGVGTNTALRFTNAGATTTTMTLQ